MGTRRKTSWMPFDYVRASDTEDSLTSSSRVPVRPASSSWPETPFIPYSERRALSEQLDRPSNAAELQKLHDGQDLARQGLNDKLSSPESRASLIPSPATTSAYRELQLDHPHRTGQALSPNPPSNNFRRSTIAEDSKGSPEPQLRIPGQIPADCDLSCSSARQSNSASDHHLPGSNDMASGTFRSNDARRPARYENRPPMSQVLCRNGPQCRKLLEGLMSHSFRECGQVLIVNRNLQLQS